MLCDVSLSNLLFISFFIFLCSGVSAAVKHSSENDRIGREEKIVMDIATQDIHRVLQASTAAESTNQQMVIGLPGTIGFEEFVRCGETPTGYCIDVFKAATEKLGHKMPSYKFKCYNGTYTELVEQVYHKRFDAAVGDITIMDNRSNYVDFTQPYMESSLIMVAPVKIVKRTWLFVKPFTTKTWLLIFSAFVYTMMVVWILEHRSNTDLHGPWANLFSKAPWFTFFNIFFAQRENVRSNYTRAVILIWFYAVFVIVTSYQASLTAMLTLRNFKPTVTNIQQIKSSNSTVGCGRNAFYTKYLEEVLGFPPENIKKMWSPEDYLNALKNGTISAAFLELPYARILLSKDPKHFKESRRQIDRLGGFGFAFPIGSPLAREFSQAFLALSEDGTLKKLDKKWFPPNTADSTSESNIEDQRLDYSNFTELFLVTGITSTVILVFYFILGLRRHPPVDHVNTGQLPEGSNETNQSPSRNINPSMSLHAASLNDHHTPRQEIQMQETYFEVTLTPRPLRQAMSFPGSDRSASGVNYVAPSFHSIPHRTSV